MEKKKKNSSVKLIAIVVMLLLCVGAAAYIVRIVKDKKAAEPEPAEEPVAEEVQEPEDTSAEDEMKAKLAHIMTNSGSSSEEKYTMAALDAAVEGGSVCLSMPVVAAKDGTLYVAYDDYLYDMTGMDGYLTGMTDGQIAEVKTKGGSDIVKLSDVFGKYGTDISYVIEIRYPNERNIMAFVDTVKAAGVADVTSLSSYYFDSINSVENELPDMPKIFLSENEVDLSQAMAAENVDTISVNKELMTDENLAAVHERGKKFSAWTLNSDEEIRKAVSMGLDSYFTDEGALAVSIEKGE